MGVSAPGGIGGVGSGGMQAGVQRPKEPLMSPNFSSRPNEPLMSPGGGSTVPQEPFMKPGGSTIPQEPHMTPNTVIPQEPHMTPNNGINPAMQQYLQGTLGTPYWQNQMQQNPFQTQQAFSPPALNQFTNPNLLGGGQGGMPQQGMGK